MRAPLERDVERRSPRRRAGAAQTSISACGRPPGCVQPRPIITPSLTTTAPTAGFGQVRPRPRRPRLSASAMKRASSPLGCFISISTINSCTTSVYRLPYFKLQRRKLRSRKTAAMALPLNLSILRMVQQYKRIPRGLLYENLPASNTEIDKQVLDLANRGAIRIDDDHVLINEPNNVVVGGQQR